VGEDYNPYKEVMLRNSSQSKLSRDKVGGKVRLEEGV